MTWPIWPDLTKPDKGQTILKSKDRTRPGMEIGNVGQTKSQVQNLELGRTKIKTSGLWIDPWIDPGWLI